MTYTQSIISACWFIVIAVWIVTGVNAKNTTIAPRNNAGRWIRFFVAACFPAFLFLPALKPLRALYLIGSNYGVHLVSIGLCIIGASFAIWARLHIGKNWGMPMTLAENPHLVTSGPYRFVRHPIYAGLCLAMIGSMLAATLLWSAWYLLWTLYFIYSALTEEKIMADQFRESFSAYKSKTKMFIPYIF